MRKFSKFAWIHFAVGTALTFSLLACGGKKDGSSGNADPTAGDIPKVTTTDNNGAGGLDTKDSGTDGANDICNVQGDAYATYGNYTMHPRDYVFNMAKDSGFDSLYTAKPATLAAADVAVAFTYYAQSDKQLFGKLSAAIETKYAAFQTAIESGEYKAVYKQYAELATQFEARKNLAAFYSTIFGLKVTWIENKDLDGELAAAIKPARDKVAAIAEADLSAAKKAEIDGFIVEAARMTSMRIADKDYAIHTVFAGEKAIRVELTSIANSFNYATYKTYTAAEMATMKERVEYYAAQMDEVEVKYNAQYATKATMKAEEFATATVTFQHQYRDLVASRELVASLMGPTYGTVNGVRTINYYNGATVLGTGTAEYGNNQAQIDKDTTRIAEIDKEMKDSAITPTKMTELQEEKNRLTREIEDLKREAGAPASSTSK